MGELEESGSTRRRRLGARCLIGRHPACDLRLDDPKVSTEHASLHWMGDRWELRDLGSRNGTWIGSRRLGAGERAVLAAGDAFSVGEPARAFTLIDASAPVAGARHVASDRLRTAQHGLLVLPDDEQPLVSIFEDASGRWVIESEHAQRPAGDHEIFTVAGEAWVLELPGTSSGTLLEGAAAPTLETIDVRLAVSRDEEHVEVTVMHTGGQTTLASRSYHYLLVLLARARLADAESSAAERGWVDRDELCRMLRIDTNRLNVDVFRLRKQLGALGVHGISGLVARRPGTGQLRLGTDRVEVRVL